ncbi:MAG TPA: L-histidine N(alpha)-methyltransferase [Roseiflexaceae bacterium]|nr:L-histidine N(alpha)-methyltransferase [Roseiflexaceae bacterium]
MSTTKPAATERERVPQLETIRDEVLHGLSLPQKELPPKLFYDERGSQLFDQITELEEYYPTRTELAITRRYAGEMAELIGPDSLLVEYGSGSSVKTRILLDHLHDLACYMPVDISEAHLHSSAAALAAAYPRLDIRPVCADYTAPFELPALVPAPRRTVVYFPGSTIGNLHGDEALRLLDQMAGLAGRGGGLLIGADLQKDRAVLERAYNDAAGVTAAFNLNILGRLNRELGATFRLSLFEHRAFYNEARHRIEMHLLSTQAQTVLVDGVAVHFEAGETIHTECSYKYSLEGFAAMAGQAGLRVRKVWTDPQGWFSVQYLTVR